MRENRKQYVRRTAATVLTVVCLSAAWTVPALAADTAVEAADGDNLQVMGNPSEGEKVYPILLKNSTGQDIVSFQVKDIYAGAYPESLLGEEDPFSEGETCLLYFDASDETESGEYNIRIGFADGSYKDMTSYPYQDMTEGELFFEDGTLFVEYESVEKGALTDTKSRELALRQVAQEAKESSMRRRSSGGSSSGGSSSGNSSSGGSSSGGAGECIGEGVILY